MTHFAVPPRDQSLRGPATCSARERADRLFSGIGVRQYGSSFNECEDDTIPDRKGCMAPMGATSQSNRRHVGYGHMYWISAPPTRARSAGQKCVHSGVRRDLSRMFGGTRIRMYSFSLLRVGALNSGSSTSMTVISSSSDILPAPFKVA